MHLSFLFSVSALLGSSLAVPLERRASNTTYDYVVVGGGTAGLVLAERLSEDSSVKVAVIEAGSYYETEDPPFSSTPASDVFYVGASPSDTNNGVDWNFVTQPQAGANSREVHYARGHCLGGSSARNFMIYQRPSIESLQQWADEVDDQSYTWNNTLPYYKKSVEFTPPSSKRAANATAKYNADAFSSTGGPLRVSYANYASPFSSYIEGSMSEAGVPTTEDFNSGSLMGSQYCASTINPADEARDSSQTSVLTKASKRANLHVYTKTMAKKVLFSAAKKAIGVEATSGLETLTISANKEVIVSAGAFQSPQLLMVSGIGPAAQLKALDITVLSDLAGVGQNMQDHIFFGPSSRVNVQTLTAIANNIPGMVENWLTEYSVSKNGPLTNPVCDFLGWEKVPSSLRSSFSAEVTSELAKYPSDWPEVEYLSGPGYIGNFSNLFKDQPKDGYQYATILAALVAPTSRGNVTITSTDTSVKPLINPNWLTTETDIAVALAGYKRVRQVFATNYMKGVTIGEEYFPGPDVTTDDQLLQVIRETLLTVWHASATCKMGVKTDSMAVIDSSARVYGVSGLRVVDASSFPFLPPGHPQSTIYMLAEKIAAEIIAGQ